MVALVFSLFSLCIERISHYCRKYCFGFGFSAQSDWPTVRVRPIRMRNKSKTKAITFDSLAKTALLELLVVALAFSLCSLCI